VPPHEVPLGNSELASARTRYVATIQLPSRPDVPLALLMPRSSPAGNLWLNGELIGACAQWRPEDSACSKGPHYFRVRPDIWRAGDNTILVELAHKSPKLVTFPTLLIGTTESLERSFAWLDIREGGALSALSWMSIFAGLIAWTLGHFSRERLVCYGFALVCWLNGITNLVDLTNSPSTSGSMLLAMSAFARLMTLSIAAITLLAFFRALTARAAALVLAYSGLAVSLMAGGDAPSWLRDLLPLPYLIVMAYHLVAIKDSATDRRTTERVALGLAVGGLFVTAAIDATRSIAWADADRMSVMPLALTGFLLILATQMIHRSAAASIRAQDLARTNAQLLAVMSHEIRTPLSGLTGTLDLACAEVSMHSTPGSLFQMARASAQRLLSVLEGAIDISRLDAGSLHLKPEPACLVSLCRTSINGFAASFDAKGLTLNLQTDLTELHVTMDRGRLVQVLDNLLSNALKFTQHGDVVVELNSTREPARGAEPAVHAIRLSVIDSGSGVPASVKERLFDVYRTSRRQRMIDRPEAGMGLGLTLCRILTHAMGGSITHEDRPQGGSVFHVRLRLPESPAPTPLKAAGTLRDPVLQSLRVLVVEDNRVLQTVICRMLARHGLIPTAVASSDEAMLMVQRTPFDVILMDVSMPGTDGRTCTQRLRSRFLPGSATNTETVPIIGLSAHASQGDAESCLEVGMNDYLTKPINWTRLFESIRLHCRRPLTHRQHDETRGLQ
jgi:signal transduction histidine kinase/CheY-like chemotaxis protein